MKKIITLKSKIEKRWKMKNGQCKKYLALKI